MMRMDVVFNGQERTFRTNNSGAYLFIGVGQNTQISCESGFNSLRRIKSAIREHLKNEWERNHYNDEKMPRISYAPHRPDDWRK